MRILHIITSLGDGGAENTLYKICKNDHDNEHIIISLKKADKYSFLLKKQGIKVYHLNMRIFLIFDFFYLIKKIRYLKPNLIQTWLVHGDLIGGLAAKLSGLNNIIWNVRYSSLEMHKKNLLNLFFIKILAILSFYIPKLIVVVSKSTKKNCINLGYDKQKLYLIPNGYELSILKFDKNYKFNFKKKFKIKKNIPIIGNVARFDPMKDHLNLINSLFLIKKKNIDFLCILVGSNINRNNAKLVSHIKKLNLEKNIKLLGKQNNIEKIMSVIDIYVQSSSYGEGFPNVVAEAMACKTPSVVTNIGDAAFIVKKTGLVSPPNNPLKLSSAIVNMIYLKKNKIRWNKRCIQARQRIAENFNIAKMMLSYNKIWKKVGKK